MILIIGETKDDVLYFDSVLANKRKEKILNRFDVSIGTLFSQDALVVHNLYASTLTSAVLMHIYEKYYIDLVFSVGRCMGVSKELKNGDIVISKKVIDVNVDLTMFDNVAMAQVPGFERDFVVQDDVVTYLSQGLDRRINANYYQAVFLSTDNMSKQMYEFLKERKTMFASDADMVVIDENAAGVALVSTLKEVPFIIAKVVENNLIAANNLESYAKVLERYIDLGKAVISTINDIGRSDILEQDYGN